MDTVIHHWPSLLLLLLGVAYLLLIQYLAKREVRPRRLTEAELLVKLARVGPYNEFEIFCSAAHRWHVSAGQVNDDFKKYLLEGLIPYYVNSFLRKIGDEIGDTYRPPFVFGGGSLPWLR